jgi:hypothetical protein
MHKWSVQTLRVMIVACGRMEMGVMKKRKGQLSEEGGSG